MFRFFHGLFPQNHFLFFGSRRLSVAVSTLLKASEVSIAAFVALIISKFINGQLVKTFKVFRILGLQSWILIQTLSSGSLDGLISDLLLESLVLSELVYQVLVVLRLYPLIAGWAAGEFEAYKGVAPLLVENRFKAVFVESMSAAKECDWLLTQSFGPADRAERICSLSNGLVRVVLNTVGV